MPASTITSCGAVSLRRRPPCFGVYRVEGLRRSPSRRCLRVSRFDFVGLDALGEVGSGVGSAAPGFIALVGGADQSAPAKRTRSASWKAGRQRPRPSR
jgi:hypothetical protein